MRGTGDTQAKARRRGRWAIGEIEYVRRWYGLRDAMALGRALGRPAASVEAVAARLFRGPRKTGPWTAGEVEALRHYLGASPPEVIARVLRRPVAEVEARIRSFGRRLRSGPWTSAEVQQLKRFYGSRTDEDLARAFGRPVSSVKRLAARYRLAKDKVFAKRQRGERASRMPRWTPEQETTLRRLYPDRSNLEIARALGRTVKSVVSKAHDLGLEKSPRRLREMGRANVAIRYAGALA